MGLCFAVGSAVVRVVLVGGLGVVILWCCYIWFIVFNGLSCVVCCFDCGFAFGWLVVVVARVWVAGWWFGWCFL